MKRLSEAALQGVFADLDLEATKPQDRLEWTFTQALRRAASLHPGDRGAQRQLIAGLLANNAAGQRRAEGYFAAVDLRNWRAAQIAKELEGDADGWNPRRRGLAPVGRS